MLDTQTLINPWPEILSETRWRNLQKEAIAFFLEAGTLALQPGLYPIARGRVRVLNSNRPRIIALETGEFSLKKSFH